MQTLARKRAETLFAEFTRLADHIDKSAEPAERPPAPRASGPKTLHLPSDERPVQTGWQVAKPRRTAKTANSGSAS